MRVLSAILICLAIAGCERVVENPEWPEYKERLVCDANISIRQDSTYVTCNLGKTIPLNQTVDFETTRVNDAQVTVTRNSETFTLSPVQMQWKRFSAYFNYADRIPTNGFSDATITCRWNGLKLSGAISIPDNLSLIADSLQIQHPQGFPGYWGVFWLHVLPNYDYTIKFSFVNGAPNSFSFYWKDEIPLGGKIVSQAFPMYGGEGNWTYSITARCTAYTDHYANGGGDVFGPSGGNPRHNMTGDGFGFLTYDITGPEVAFTVK
jgi:hypothetical protein